MQLTLSCRVVSGVLRRLRREGVDLTALVSGLPLGLPELLDPRRTLPWNVFAAIMARVELTVGGPALLTELGARMGGRELPAGFGRALALVASARTLYRALDRRIGQLLGAQVQRQLADGGHGRLVYRLTAPEGCTPCPQLFRLIAGCLRRAPHLLGQPDAVIDADVRPRSVVFVITPPPSMTLWSRLMRAVRVFVSARATLEELSAQSEALNDRLAELARARDRAEAAARAKSQFLANMSHELRTPLNAILGTSSALLEVPRPEAERDDLLVLHHAAEQLLDLVTDTLAVSGDTQDRKSMRVQGFDLHALVRVVLATSGAEERGMQVEVEIGEGSPRYVRGDEGRLRRALSKLVSNAVKFGRDEGKVVVAVARDPRRPDGVLLSVIDDGPGIPEEALPTLFDPFSQLDTSMTRAREGAGLGLSVTRELVDRMGGTIDVQSSAEQGTRFRVHLVLPEIDPSEVRVSVPTRAPPPLRVAAPQPTPLPIDVALSLAPGRVTPVPEPAGLPPWPADVGVGHVQPRVTPAPAEPIDAVAPVAPAPERTRLHDAQAVRAAIRAVGGREEASGRPLADAVVPRTGSTPSGADTPAALAALAAEVTHAAEPDELASRGGSRDVPRPLSAAPDGALGPTRVAPPRQTSSTARGLPPLRTEDLPGAQLIRRRVLVVEDNVVNQRLIVRIVEKLGCDVRVVGDGRQALETLEREEFHAVLMDCQMPVMDGYDATRALRAREALHPPSHLPVIAVTAHATDGDRERCLEAGMDDYLTKPVRAEALTTTLVSWLSRSQN
jgi:signal transduction histidine kinase/ActR/RegA family two-component response regulator